MKKIAYLSDSDIPSYRANSVHVMKMCAALSKKGFDVTLIGNSSNVQIKEDVYNLYGLVNTFRINVVKAFALPKLRIFMQALSKYQIVKKGNFDICYCRSLLSAYLIRNDKPFFYESHISPNRILYKLLEKKILKHKNLIKHVVICNELKKEYLKIFPFLDNEKIIVLHDGADPVYSLSVENCPIKIRSNNESVKIGYIGHLYPGKCMEILLQIAQRKKDVSFHVIGGVEEWIEHWKKIAKENSVENVIFYGYVDNRWVNECYSQLDIVLLPFSNKIFFNKNKKDDIGKWISPLKLFEAMANGCTIISSKLPSIQEILQNGINSYLVDADDIDGWCRTIEFLSSDADTRKKIGDKARFDFETQYTWNHRAEIVAQLIEEWHEKH